MKRIVIFGATGNIGAYLVDYLLNNLAQEEYEVIAVGRRKTQFFEKMGVSYYQVDITREKDFECLPTENIHAVVNIAGLLPAYMKKYDPFRYVDTNICGALRIMEYARKNHADRILYTQTWSVQGGYWGKETVLSPAMPRELVYTGDHAFYCITKNMIEDTLEHYMQEYGIKRFVFRLPNVYLYHPDKYYYVDNVSRPIGYRYMIDKAISGEPIEIWGDPNAYKDVLYVKDLCQMMAKAIQTNKVNGGVYNAGTGKKTTLREQIEGMIQVFSNKDHPSEIIAKPEKNSFTSFVMDISNAKEDLGYEPQYSYLEYLEDYKRELELQRFNSLWLTE